MQEALESVNKRIREAAISCGREPESVRLVAVSKTVPADRIKQAAEAGAQIIGENYVQEAREKFKIIGTLPLSWHFIGHLQSNKAKYAVRLFDLIHSVDSEKLAAELKCATCHQKNYRGVESIPRLARQNRVYLATQMKLFRDGERTNDNGLKSAFMSTLTDEQIKLLSHYFSGM